MSGYSCPQCGAAAYYDGRCGDSPVLLCNCRNQGPEIRDRDGGSYRPDAPKPVHNDEVRRDWPVQPGPGGRD